MADDDLHELMGRMDGHMERFDVLMERIDGHMERGNVLMERIDGHMERGNVLMERNEEAFRRAEAAAERDRLAFENLRAYLAHATEILVGLTTAIEDGRKTFQEETRAQRDALFRILDRLDGNGGAQPGAA